MRISNIQYPISNAKWGSKFTSYVLSAISSQLSANSQAGVAQLALVMLLLAGVAVGTYVVQNRTNLIPHAQECTETRLDNECRDDGYIYEIYQDCNGDYRRENTNETCGEKDQTESCGYDQKSVEYSCKNGYRCFEDYFKDSSTSCKWQYKDPHFHCDEDSKCSTDAKNSADKNEEECRNSGNVWEDNTCKQKAVSKGPSGPGSSDDNKTADNTSYDQGDCRDGAKVYKDGYTWITYCTKVCSKNSDCPKNTTDGAVNPETSNWCYGFNGGKAPRCMMLVQSDNKEVNDQSRKSSNSKAVEEIKSTIAQGGDPNPAAAAATQSSSADFKAKIDAQNTQRGSLVSELATVLNNAGSGNSSLTGAVNRAQSLITSAASSAAACYTGTDKPLNDSCDATTQAANDIAVAASRVALFDAVAAGVPNTCVKVDMAVGANTSNSIIEVAPAENASNLSRLFMCRGAESATGKKDGDIKWRVRDNNGSLQEVSQTSLTQLGLQNGQKQILTIPENFIVRRNNAAALSSQPAFAGTTTLNFNETSSTAWKEVAVSNCLSNCSSFPSGAACYQKGTTNEYNCNGANQTQSTVSEKKNLAKNATCNDNKECRSGQCNPGTSKCL